MKDLINYLYSHAEDGVCYLPSSSPYYDKVVSNEKWLFHRGYAIIKYHKYLMVSVI